MRLRVVGTNAHKGEPYYLREEFEVEDALREGFRIYQDSEGWVYGNPGERTAFGGWTARVVPQTQGYGSPNDETGS